MDVREKLTELLITSPQLEVLDLTTGWEEAVNYLIAHGVTVQVCKLEDKKTNADRIRAMTDAQLVQMLTIGRGGFSCSKCAESEDCGQNCEVQCLKWLQQPAEEAGNG